jgi:hypothetical protein
MNEADLEALFRRWWAESYPMAPVNKQAVASHVAFAAWLLRSEALPNLTDN